MSAQLEFKTRVRLGDEIPLAEPRGRRVPLLALAGAGYWAAWALVGLPIFGEASLLSRAIQAALSPAQDRLWTFAATDPTARVEPQSPSLEALGPSHAPAPDHRSFPSPESAVPPPPPALRAAPLPPVASSPAPSTRAGALAEPSWSPAPAPPAPEPVASALAAPATVERAHPARRTEAVARLAAPGPSTPTRAQVEPPPIAAPKPVSGAGSAPPSLGSCEAAVAANNERMDVQGARGPADLTASAYAAVLDRGSYFAHCQPPPRTAIEICAAVQHGKAVGVTVTTRPRDAALQRCIAGAVSTLRFPAHPKLDVARTHFAAER
ncbi:MAG TPA: hypothetical protein VKZ49_19210 [Polyangiaceae bacterium]|nr:hypothetical protein [Polyangiaceae bacterium]